MADALPPFATSQQVTDFSGGMVSATDPRLADAVAGVSARIRRYCGWHITPSMSDEVTLDGPGGPELDLPSLYVMDVASVTDEGVLLDPTLYTWSQLGQVRLHHAHFTHHYQGVTVAFTHGYDDAPELTEVVTAAICRMLASPSGAVQERVGEVLVRHAESTVGVAGGLVFLQPEYEVLDSYRIVSA